MNLKRLTQFSKDLLDIGKEILNRSFSRPELNTPPEQEEGPSDLERERLIKKFEVPTPDNPAESSRQQSLVDSQPQTNPMETYEQNMNHNMGQRNFHNHEQN